MNKDTGVMSNNAVFWSSIDVNVTVSSRRTFWLWHARFACGLISFDVSSDNEVDRPALNISLLYLDRCIKFHAAITSVFSWLNNQHFITFINIANIFRERERETEIFLHEPLSGVLSNM